MPKKRHSPEEIIQHIRTLEIEQAKGATLEAVAKKIAVTPQTLIRWKSEYGGLRVDQAKKLKELEQENSRLKRLVADKELDILILKEACRGN
jgi:transposase-like protein